MENYSPYWLARTFFGSTKGDFNHPVEMGVRQHGHKRVDIVWKIGRNISDGRLAFLGLYENPLGSGDLQVPADHAVLVDTLRVHSAKITPLFGYTLWSHSENGVHVKVPSQITLPEFQGRRYDRMDRIAAARFSDALILASTIGLQSNSSSNVKLEGVLLNNPSVSTKALLSPVVVGKDGSKSNTNHGIVYSVEGYPNTHGIFEAAGNRVLELVTRNALSKVLLNVAYNLNMVR